MAASRVPPVRRRSIGNKLIAVILWGLSCYATYQFFVSVSGEGPAAFLISITAQTALTFGESSMWRGDITGVGIVALAFDTFTNIGGTFFYIGNLEKSASWQAVATTIGASSDVSGYTQLFLAIFVGVVLAAAPEALWKQL